MNLAFYIYRFLQEEGACVKVPNFGIFSLEKYPAKMDEEISKIVPPREVVSFNKQGKGDEQVLAHFISKKMKIEEREVFIRMKEEVDKWNEFLKTNKKIKLGYLGDIELVEERYIFTQNMISNFGLEEIYLPLVELKNENGVLKRSILWLFLVVFPLVGLVFLGLRFKNFDFGSFSVQNTPRIEESTNVPVPYKKDSISRDSISVNLVQDSLNIIK